MSTLLVVAGEASGDLHGAEILKVLKARRPELRIVGIGGERMSPFLDRKLADVRDLGVVGFVGVIRHLPQLRRLFGQLLETAVEEEVSAALLIDYPGFNLRLAKALRKTRPSTRLHQYVCPQVWAWKAGRIPELGRTLDTLYCLFDFEPSLFDQYPVEALWMGNPIVETAVPEVGREVFFQETDLDPHRPVVALLPGSRRGELQRLLPPMISLVRNWQSDPKHRDIQWVLPVAPTLTEAQIRQGLGSVSIHLVENRSFAARAYADAALVCSGTATLETALLGTPFAIVYRLNALEYQLAKRFVKLPHFGLVNVVAGRLLVPELLQHEVNPDRLSAELSQLLAPDRARLMRDSFSEIRSHLGEPGAAERVAEHLISKL